MKPRNLLRFAGPALFGGLLLVVTPAAFAQSASTYVASASEKYRMGDFDSAIEDYTKALDLNSSYLGAYNGRGLAKSHQGNFDGAIADFSAAIKLKPAFTEAYFNRGNAAFLQGNMDMAIADYSKVIELKPDHGQAYFHRALARDCETNYDGAASDYAKAKELQPGNGEANSSIAVHAALLAKRTGDDVNAQLKPAVGWSDAWSKGLASFLSGKISEDQLLSLAGRAEGDVQTRQQCEAWYFIGMTKLIAGNKVAAKADFQKAFDASGPSLIVHRLARVELDRS